MTPPRQSTPAEPIAASQCIRAHLDTIKIGDATMAWKALGGIRFQVDEALAPASDFDGSGM
jgi:hypothetical protein